LLFQLRGEWRLLAAELKSLFDTILGSGVDISAGTGYNSLTYSYKRHFYFVGQSLTAWESFFWSLGDFDIDYIADLPFALDCLIGVSPITISPRLDDDWFDIGTFARFEKVMLLQQRPEIAEGKHPCSSKF
jgi:hypothetical protein